MHDFYMIDAKVEEVARALGLMEIGLDRDVTELSGGQRTKVLLGKLLLEKPHPSQRLLHLLPFESQTHPQILEDYSPLPP